jgi:transposase InsO family protein
MLTVVIVSGLLETQAAVGLIMHSDRGSQYASDEHRQLIKHFQMIQSMSRRANCWDNAAIESFFSTLKVERVYQLRYDTRADARLDIVDWIEGVRDPHSSIYWVLMPASLITFAQNAFCCRMNAANSFGDSLVSCCALALAYCSATHGSRTTFTTI